MRGVAPRSEHRHSMGGYSGATQATAEEISPLRAAEDHACRGLSPRGNERQPFTRDTGKAATSSEQPGQGGWTSEKPSACP